jgi:hypothetical protein
VSDIERQNQRELAVLAALDREDGEAWCSMVAFMAPQLCRENNKLLIEILSRRAARLKAAGSSMDVHEILAGQMAIVGVRLELIPPAESAAKGGDRG